MDLLLLPGVLEDLKKLSEELQEECLDTLIKLQNNIHLGKPLEEQEDRDLRDCFKLYFDKARYRIIYTKEMKGSQSTAKVWGIGPRDKKEVYVTVAQRREEVQKKNAR